MTMSISRRSSAQPPCPCPWLVYCHGKRFDQQTFCCNISGGEPINTYRKKISALHDKRVLSCYYGWLFLYHKNTNLLSLCDTNASTFTTIDLPILKLSHENENYTCILSSSPSNPDSKVLLFSQRLPSIMWCRIGDEEWSEIRYGKQLEDLNLEIMEQGNLKKGSLLLHDPVGCRGKIYARFRVANCCTYPEWWSIEITEEPIVHVVLNRINNGTKRIHRCSGLCKEYMVESDGELFAVHIMLEGTNILKIEVNKLNFDTMDWEILESLEDRSFFVCPEYCFSCPVSGPGYIYFTKKKDKNIYCYCMEDESVSVSLPCRNLPKPWRSPIWIMPGEPPIRLQEEDHCNDSNEERNDTLSKDYCEENLVKNIECEKLLSDNSKLPTDILEEITKHLEPLDYLNFRATSRRCRSVAPPVNWRTSLLGSEYSLPYPFLMLPQKDQNWYNLVDPITTHRYVMKIPEILNDTTIRYSDYGWLIMSRNRDVHLYNPITRDLFSTKTFYENSFFLASKPSGSDCFFVGVDFHVSEVEVITYYPSTNTCTSHELQSNKDFFPVSNNPVTFYKDAYYCVDNETGNVGKIKLEEEEENCSWEVLDNLQKPPCGSFQYNFLVECGGELLLVYVGRDGRWVHVYKLNQFKTAWDIVLDLGKYNLYVSRPSSFSVMANPSAARNRIYFPRFRDSKIVFYSLDTQKWHSSGSEDSFNDFYGTKLMLESCWIKPSWC